MWKAANDAEGYAVIKHDDYGNIGAWDNNTAKALVSILNDGTEWTTADNLPVIEEDVQILIRSKSLPDSIYSIQGHCFPINGGHDWDMYGFNDSDFYVTHWKPLRLPINICE